MSSNTKNIILLVILVSATIMVYFFFLRKPASQPDLVSSTTSGTDATTTEDGSTAVNSDFISLLLNVKNIKLDDEIFSDPAFISLHDSTIILNPDNSPGRPNPFAPLGADIVGNPATAPSLPGLNR